MITLAILALLSWHPAGGAVCAAEADHLCDLNVRWDAKSDIKTPVAVTSDHPAGTAL
ncbi:hypothetical protein So717_01880 [Roseobacter cerasinus]|uniref:Uncharacterized protein n=1 Tax=Roseobacter cerasinus TaxID=2602289 RepID=A0A640VNK0_9RHOB|nr:hypothetical protein So717_01880 [Roseobacter cerasinus]